MHSHRRPCGSLPHGEPRASTGRRQRHTAGPAPRSRPVATAMSARQAHRRSRGVIIGILGIATLDLLCVSAIVAAVVTITAGQDTTGVPVVVLAGGAAASVAAILVVFIAIDRHLDRGR